MTGPRVPRQGVPLDVAHRGRTEAYNWPVGGSFPSQPPAARVVDIYLPEIFPIPGAEEFTVNNFTQSPGAGVIEPATFQFQVPEGCRGIIRTFGQGINALTAVTNLLWSLKINGGPVSGYTEIQFFPGPAARVTSSQDCFVRVPVGGLISVAITNVDGAVYQVGANFSGWFWPITAEAQWLGRAP